MELLPTSPNEKLEYLLTAAKHGEAVRELAKIGAAAANLRAYAEQTQDLSLTKTGADRIILRYGDLVNWVITIDENDLVQGYGFSGFKELMEELGIDFSGRKYEAN